MRPHYETEADLAREKALIARLTKEWKCRFKKLPETERLDYLMTKSIRGVLYPRGFMEIKVRTNPLETYPTYMISLAKFQAGMELAAKHGIPFYIVVQFADCVCRAIHYPSGVGPTLQYTRGIGGRSDRGDVLDREPVALIPISAFKELWHG